MADAAIVFIPPLGQTLCIAAGRDSFTVYATSPTPVDLKLRTADNNDRSFALLDIPTIGHEELFTYEAVVTLNDAGGEISVLEGDNKELGKLALLQTNAKGIEHDFVTEITLSENEEFKSLRLPWLVPKDWEGWAWYRLRETWIEARYTSLTELSPHTPTHALLLRPKTTDIDPESVLAVFPASSEHAFVTLSNSRNGDPPGIYARVRRIKKGGGIKIYVTGKLLVENNTTSALPGAVQIAREKYGLPVDIPFIEDSTGSPFDRLGFCTWSSIGENVPLSYDLMENLVKLLHRDGVKVGTFLIDDGWQDIRYGHNGEPMARGLWSFETWAGMNSSLADNVALIKKYLPTVKDFGVWMTLAGYWNSVSPYSPLARKYDMRIYHLDRACVGGIEWLNNGFDRQQTGTVSDPELRAYCLPPPHRTYEFWKDYFSSCASAGITFVKVDNQAYQSFLRGVEGGEEFVSMWNSMTKAANDTFGENRVIHCMAHYERMFNGDIGMGAATKGRKILIRNTDDFGLPRPNVHRDHIRYNLYNGMLLSHQSLTLDADMFMTSAQWPEYHAILRAFFNGPVFLADKPGKGDAKVHAKLTGRSRRDDTYRTIRAAQVIRPLKRNVWEKSIQDGRGPSIKASSYFPDSQSASIVLWNARSDAKDHSVDLLFEDDIVDCLGTTISVPWDGIVWANQSQKAVPISLKSVSNPSQAIPASRPVLEASLKPESFESITVAPIHKIGVTSIAALGLIDKYAALAGIGSCIVAERSLITEAKFDGILGFVITDTVEVKATIDDEEAKVVRRNVGEGLTLVEVDLHEAPQSVEKENWTVTITV